MSYILDALRKAAELRGATTSVLFRPAPAQIGAARSWRTPWIVVGGLLVINVMAMIWIFRPVSGPDLPPRTASESSRAPAVAPPPPTASTAAPAMPSPAVPGPAPSAPPAAVPNAAPTLTPAPPSPVPMLAPVQRPADLIPPTHAPAVRATPKTPSPPSNRATASRAVPTEARTVPTEPRAIVPERSSIQPAPEPPATPRSRSERPAGVIEPMPQPRTPSPSAARSAPGDRGKLKLEVVSYSDTPAQRLVFISGRKYVEGDTTEGGFRVEQIKEDSVVLSDQGVRFTLR